MIHAVLYMGQSNVSGVEITGLPSGVPLSAVRMWIRGISGGTTDSAWHDLTQWPDSSAAFGPALAMGVAMVGCAASHASAMVVRLTPWAAATTSIAASTFGPLPSR